MLKINVLQNEDELLKLVLKNAFCECNMDMEFDDDSEISIFSVGTTLASSSARIVILPDAKSISTTAHEIITYGLCCKNTLTISSYIGSNMVLSIQRSIKTLTGAEVEVQDFPITISDPNEPEVVLGAVAALIACDVPISQISTLPF